MSTSNVDANMSTSPSTQAEGLLPAFSARQYPHLPTPQSPGNLARYVLDRPHSPESPIPNGNGVVHSASTSSTHHSQRAGHRKMSSDDNTMRIQANLHQYATPESSPQYVLSSPLLTTATPRHLIPTSTEFTTPKQQSSFSDIKLESPIPISLPTKLPRVSSSSPPPELSGLQSSSLSSPFMAKASTAGRKSNSLLDPLPIEVDDVFSSSNVNSPGRANLTLPPQHPTLEPGPTANSGGEFERIRQARREEVLLQIQEAEKRRPEYLKRAKRTLSEADPSYLEEEENTRDRALGVGITESPHKGRRLTLFQETSEESFEESLMAGGYGRYRTADWVRQPQPISLPANPVAGSPLVVSRLEEADEAPPTEKETKKRKRLAAFRSEPNQSSSKLCAVELEGRGRVLIDVPSEEPVAPASPEPTPSKKRGTNRRKRKGENLSIDKNPPGTSKVENHGEKPNWPDSEFPWRLRTEERIELAKAEEEERLRCIERFLDRDSDDEDEEDSNVPIQNKTSLSARLEDESQPDDYQVKMGRGKMVPVRVYPGEMERPNFVSRTSFPSDPSDARAALLSKKSVRTLSYRQQKRQRELGDDEEEEIVCICHGKDDGRELVQCDACQTWYHLECIGIKNIAELGKEEDPWFCRGCVARSPSPPTKANSLQPSEPTFVPTDNEPNVRGSSDTPFFQPSLQDSPSWRLPKTPTRGGSFSTFSDSSHSWSSWADSSSRPGPYTPQHSLAAPRGHDGHIYYEESPFDPTSTPSRGIRFHPSLATPKNTGFPRSAGLFQTPSKSTARGSMHRSFGSTGPPVDDSGGNPSSHDHFARIFPYDESPIRRNRSSESSIPRRKLHSPSRSKTSTSVLEESPIVRSQLQRTAWNDDGDHIS